MADTTIEGLRVHQWGVEAVKAQGTLSIAVQPTATETFTIGSKVYTFVASGASTDGQINLGALVSDTRTNVLAAINGTDGWNVEHALVSAAAFVGNDSVITAKHPGPAGDAIVFTETMAGAGNVMDGSGTLGGTTAGAFARGTPVAATSKIAISMIEWGDDDENLHRPSYANGLLIRNRGDAVAVQHGTRFSFSDQDVIWEQLVHWLSMSVKGDVQPTLVTGSPDVWRWIFDRAPSTNPTPHSFTLERRFSNGLGDNVDQRASYAMLSELTFTYAENEQLRMSGSGFARKFETAAITSALTMPTTEPGVSGLSVVSIDDTWANLGVTPILGQVIGWEFAIGTGLMPRVTADNRSTLDFSKHQISREAVTLGLKLDLLLEPTTYATELAAAAAGTRRAIRVKVVGSGGRQMYLDGLFQHSKPSLFKVGEQDGQDLVQLELEEATDGTNYLKVTVEHPTVDVLD